jgi:hypothetical protein
MQLGSMADSNIASDILKRVRKKLIEKFYQSTFYQIIPNVDSLGINEQELTFLSKVGGGPFNERYPISAGTLHAYKVSNSLLATKNNPVLFIPGGGNALLAAGYLWT